MQAGRGDDGAAPAVRVHPHVVASGKLRDLLHAGDALGAARIHQDDIAHIRLQQPKVIGSVPEALAETDHHAGHGLAQVGVPLHMLRGKHVLQPCQVVRCKRLRHADRVGHVPVHLGADVDDETGIADRTAHGADELNVAAGAHAQIGMPLLAEANLHQLVAVLNVHRQLGSHRVDLRRLGMRAGAGGQLLLLLSAQQLDQRHAQQLALQIPQRHIQRADGEGGDAAHITVPPHLPAQHVPQRFVVQGVLTDQQIRQPVFQQRHRRVGRLAKLRDRLAPAHCAIAGLDARERDVTRDVVVVRLRIAEGVHVDPADGNRHGDGLSQIRSCIFSQRLYII